jgi:hypothetical protein
VVVLEVVVGGEQKAPCAASWVADGCLRAGAHDLYYGLDVRAGRVRSAEATRAVRCGELRSSSATREEPECDSSDLRKNYRIGASPEYLTLTLENLQNTLPRYSYSHHQLAVDFMPASFLGLFAVLAYFCQCCLI